MAPPIDPSLAAMCRHPEKPIGAYNNDAVAMFIVRQAKAIDTCIAIVNPK